jgi:hypothetical protein
MRSFHYHWREMDKSLPTSHTERGQSKPWAVLNMLSYLLEIGKQWKALTHFGNKEAIKHSILGK